LPRDAGADVWLAVMISADNSHVHACGFEVSAVLSPPFVTLDDGGVC
jgi:hypothetical protein